MLQTVFTQLFTLLLMIGAGFLLRKKKLVSERFQGDLSEIVLWLALPCSIIEAGLQKTEENAAFSIAWAIVLSVVCYAMVILLTELLIHRLHFKNGEKELFACMLVFANTAFIGIPICSVLIGSKGVFYAAFFNMVFNLFFFTYGVRRIMGRRIPGLKNILLHDPGMVSTVIMLVLFITQWHPPSFVLMFVNSASGVCTPLSMLVLGCMLTQVDLVRVFHNSNYWLLSLLRLVIIPALSIVMVCCFAQTKIDKDILFMLIIMCAMPTGSLTAIYAVKYRAEAEFVTGGIIHTLVCFCISFPLVVIVAKWILSQVS